MYSGELARMRRLLGTDIEVYKSLQAQFGILLQRQLSMFALASITITTAGFSGNKIAASGPISLWLMVLGLLFALCSICVSLHAISRIRWLSSYSGSLEQSFKEMTAERDRKANMFIISTSLLAIGLLLYVASICRYLMVSSNL